MIARDRNRASVILWSVANETPISDRRATASCATLVARRARLDPHAAW